MPSVPTGPQIFDQANTILNAARVRVNDELKSLIPTSGKILEATDAFTHQVFNNGYRRMQETLSNMGWTGTKAEIIVENLPLVATLDPASQCFINWFNFFDGVNFWDAPTLPDNLVHPLKVWQRYTGQNMPFPKQEMECYLDGLPNWQKTNVNGGWEWRENSIYLTGATQAIDLRILYVKYLPDIVDVGNDRWFRQQVPIARCQEPLSLFVAAEFASSRIPSNEAEAAAQSGATKSFQDRAEIATKLIFNRDVKMKQRVNVSRIPRSGRGGMGGSGYWGGGYGDGW